MAAAAPMPAPALAGEVAPSALATDALATDALVIVNGVALHLDGFAQLLTVDALMAGLAGQAPSTPRALLEQWVNGELVWQQASAAGFVGADVAGARTGFLAQVGRTQADLDAALAAAPVAPGFFADYWQRLITVEQFAQRGAAAQGISTELYVRALQQAARISFGPAASTLFAPSTAAAPVAVAPISAPPNAVAAAVAVTAAAESAAATAVRGVETGMLAPDFLLEAVNSAEPVLAFADLQGKPAVLSFWTTWCPYCLRQTPVMVEAYPRAAAAGIEFVGIDVQEERNTVAAYLAQHAIQYPILFDEHGTVSAQYGVQGYPTTYFLDSTGRVVAHNVGALTGEQLNTYLQMLGLPDSGP